MKLTGKAKVEFEKWFEFDSGCKPFMHRNEYVTAIESFYNLPKSMQCGVYVDFFDSFGIKISIINISDAYWFVINNVNTTGKKDRYECKYMSRPEARTTAIEKANEIYNEK